MKCCASLEISQKVLMAAAEPAPSIRTLRLKVKREAYAWLKSAATEVNAVWNFANETSYKAARPFAGPSRRLSAFDLDKLSARACECFERIGSGTIQRVNAEYATRRRQFKRSKLRWRKSYGSHRSLGWVPFKAQQLGRKGKCLRFSGKAIRVFEQALLEGVRCKSGCFAEDSVGDWWLCVAVARATMRSYAPRQAVGLDLGLKDTVATSDGATLEAGQFYRHIEQKIAQAQRRAHKRQAKRLHRSAARRRKDALHKFSRSIVDQYQRIVVGDVSSVKLVETRMAKSVLDAGWGMLKRYLQYKGQEAGRDLIIVSERNTSVTCSACGALTGPRGVNGLIVRSWTCRDCGESHDRDVNAARNILIGSRCRTSVSGNELSPWLIPPSSAYRVREAGIETAWAAA